jgi:ribonuclease HII
LDRSQYNLTLFSDMGPINEGDTLFFESRARKSGFSAIAGVDEAGRGPLAGPVVAGAVILPPVVSLRGVRDSKKMTEKARGRAFSDIARKALAVGIGVVSHQDIDKKNILVASLEAMKRAVLALEPSPDFLLVDGIQRIALPTPQLSLKKGDQLSLSISAASVMAKVYRDRIMRAYDEQYPDYGFAQNKGYGTARHVVAIKRFGPCPVHRRTFKGVMQGDQVTTVPR